jgi:hypothetical protein
VTRAVDRTEHTAEHPSWDCRACGQPWPCGSARERLLVEFRGWPSALTIYLDAQPAAAYDDIPGITPEQLHERFLAWTRSPGQ